MHSAVFTDKKTKTTCDWESEVEKWLKKGGQITELLPGETQYPDGRLPPIKPVKAYEDSSNREEEIQKRNESIQKYNDDLLLEKRQSAESKKKDRERQKRIDAQKRSKVRELKKQQEQEQKNERRIQRALAKEKKEQDRIVLKGCSKLKLKSFPELKAEYWRRVVNNILRKSAINKKADRFEGKCKSHGWTTFLVGVQHHSCRLCTHETMSKLRHPGADHEKLLSEHERRNKNQSLMLIAHEQNLKCFDGVCANCGPTTLSITIKKDKPSYYCNACVGLNRQNRLYGDNPEYAKRQEYINAFSVAKKLAIAEGKDRIEFRCNNHGMTTYAVYAKNNAMYCIRCKQESRHRTAQKKGKKIDTVRLKCNKERAEKAIDAQSFSFIGKCSIHGDTEYGIIKSEYDAKGKIHTFCRMCKRKTDIESTEERKAKADADVELNLLKEFFTNNGHIRKKTIAALLGVTPLVLANTLKGKTILCDERRKRVIEILDQFNNSL